MVRKSSIILILLLLSFNMATYGESPVTDDAFVMCAKLPMTADGIVRLSMIEVYPQYIEKYAGYATEIGEVSLRTEPGVLAMYAMREKDNPCKVTILEIYASREAYESHIASEHFQKYKRGTLHMVKSLILSDQTPMNPNSIINNHIKTLSNSQKLACI